MKVTSPIILLAVSPLISAAADSPRPRGVSPEFAKFYKSKDTFTCISNPTISIPFSQVNDDYCDCPDGSDEPGTSACSYLDPLSPSTPADTPLLDPTLNLNNSLALPGFYCKNKGHMPGHIPFQNVNDGVCDYEQCCDGSDEWAGVGGVKCPDKCKEIGKEWRKQDETRRKAMSGAQRKRKELVKEAGRLVKEIEDRIRDLETQVIGADMKVRELEVALQETKKKESGKVVKGVGKGGKVAVLAGLAKERIEELRNNLVDLRKERNAAKARLDELERLLKTFKEEYNPNFNDEGVKRAVRSWDDYAAREKEGIADDDVWELDLEEIASGPAEGDAIKWDEWQGQSEEEDDLSLLYQFEAYLPKSLRDWADQKLRELRQVLVENGILAAGDKAPTTTESKAVADARSALDLAKSTLIQVSNQLSTAREDLNKDYGPDSIFLALKGKCVSKDSGEYTYELCWLDRTSQKSKKGGGETNMGNFRGLEKVMVDDEIRADGRSLGSGERIAMRYDGGQHCWNGPSRSTLVVLGCSETEEIWKITEEEKCVYRMEVGTAAVCEQEGGKKVDGQVYAKEGKDEL